MPIGPGSSNAEVALVAAALAEQDLTLVDTVPLPVPPAGAPRKRGEPAAASIDLDLAADEDAVVLLERDGMYAWQFEADRTETKPTASAGGSRRAAPSGRRQVKFRIALAPAEAASGDAGRVRRGLFSDAIKGLAKALVFKFAGRFLVDRATSFLERHVQPGVMPLQGNDPTAWPLIGDFRSVSLPEDRPGRILLFIHGTFSSTQGGFGALCATPWGKSFLDVARANYDAVIGFDHPTLSVDPRANATELLRAIEAREWKRPVEIDIICHSRGAITVRSLTEHLLPATRLPLTIGRIIFVGGVNGGTLLAAPENWRTLIDLYTNLGVGAMRAMALFPSTAFAAGLLGNLLQGIGALAKALVQSAIEEKAMPGLAAMNPAGPFIKELNRTQPGQPAADACSYYAITSDFEAKLALGKASELPGQLIKLLADGFMDRLMQTDNDLVVNVDAMTAIDLHAGNFIKDTLAFGTNGIVYHTNYFLQPQAIQAMARWLELKLPDASGAVTRRTTRAGAIATPPPAATVDRSFTVVSASDRSRILAALVKEEAPSYVVIERSKEKRLFRYAFTPEELLPAAKANPGATLEDTLNLHEYDSSQEGRPGAMPAPKTSDSGHAASRRTVVTEGGTILGVAEPHVMPQTLQELSAIAAGSARPADPIDRVRRQRTALTLAAADGSSATVEAPSLVSRPLMNSPKPSFGLSDETESAPPKTKSPTATKPAAAAAAEVTCHCLAEMEDEVVVKETTSVDVTLSRELLTAARANSAKSTVKVSATRKLILDLVTKKNFVAAGDSRVEIDVPAIGEPANVVFDVQGTDVGDGEVWVRIRQGAQPLATLVLRCRIVGERTHPPRRSSVDASVEDNPPTVGPLHQLTIFENERGGKRVYQFIFDSPKLGWRLNYESKPLEGRREDYVAHIYEDIEGRWLSNEDDFTQFELELKEVGAGLWNELVPEELRKVLWQEKDKIDSILVFSEEPFIPWELVFLTQPGESISEAGRFLGEMGLVRWQHNVRWPPVALRARPDRCWYVIPKYQLESLQLAEAEKEAAFLKAKFKARPIEPKLAPVREKLAGPGAFDLLHFACHGDANSTDISRAELLLEGRVENGSYIYERLRPSVVAYSAKFTGPDAVPPIVVLNACRAGRQGYKLTSVGGFAREFLTQGAGLFVGALWSVGDSPARDFTEELYTRLLAGDTLARATVAARKKARKAQEGTWLAYTVYGNPQAKLTTK